MKYRNLPLRCECGRTTLTIREVGLTTDHQLVLHWRCSACKKFVYVVKSLADCWKDCPTEDGPGQKAIAELMTELTAAEPDESFLHRLGVCYPDDDAS